MSDMDDRDLFGDDEFDRDPLEDCALDIEYPWLDMPEEENEEE